MTIYIFFFFQAEDGIRDLVRSRGLGDVYKRQPLPNAPKIKINIIGKRILKIIALGFAKMALKLALVIAHKAFV